MWVCEFHNKNNTCQVYFSSHDCKEVAIQYVTEGSAHSLFTVKQNANVSREVDAA